MKKFYLMVSTLFFLAMLAPEGAKAEPFDTIFVFGDSLSDNGNAYNLSFKIPNGGFPPPPYSGVYSS
jgi:phospholipase/lecithinase/hemolysin